VKNGSLFPKQKFLKVGGKIDELMTEVETNEKARQKLHNCHADIEL
jgi:hypothetical protein